MQTITLNNGVEMPMVGMGVFRMTGDEVRAALPVAFDAGYRLIDTAALYGNEEAVGEVVAASGLPRDELFVTTKVWYRDFGRDATLRAFEKSLSRLGIAISTASSTATSHPRSTSARCIPSTNEGTCTRSPGGTAPSSRRGRR